MQTLDDRRHVATTVLGLADELLAS
jgi:hypothetical protein